MQQPWAALVVPAELDGPTLELFCEFLTKLNERYLLSGAGRSAPALYQSGAFYKLQPEYWLTIPHAMHAIRVGLGLDCKSLSAWRAAELRIRGGEPGARCIWSAHPTAEKVVYHVRVRRQNGQVEDPSALLGMNAALPPSGTFRSPYALGP